MNQHDPSEFDRPPNARPGNRGKKLRELAFVLPVVGALLFLSPIMNAVTADNNEPHLLPLVVYVFGVWAFLILCSVILSRFLADEMDGE